MARPIARLQRLVDHRERELDEAHGKSVRAVGVREQAEHVLRELIANPPRRPAQTTVDELQLLLHADERHRIAIAKARAQLVAAVAAEQAARKEEILRKRALESMKRAVERRVEEAALVARRLAERELDETVRHFGDAAKP